MTSPNSAAFAAGAERWNQEGLTKREYFAAMAIQGIAANPQNEILCFENCGEMAVRYANALINALNENQQ